MKPPSTKKDIAEKVFALLSEYRHSSDYPGFCATQPCSRCSAIHTPRLLRLIEQQQKIRLLLPAFPAKSANPKKTLGPLPDRGELLALKQLNQMAQAIDQIYPHGVEILICSDGRVFNDLVFVDDRYVDAYQQAIKQMIEEHQLMYLNTFSLDEVYKNVNYEQMRQKLMEQFAASDQAITNTTLFNGIHRFLFEDSLHVYPHYSKNQVRKRAKQLTYQVIQRSNAWSQLIKHMFPDAIRLSIHPQACGSEKLGIQMLPSKQPWATPWHNVLVYDDDKYQLMHREEAELLGANLVYQNGLPSHYSLQMTQNQPFGLTIKTLNKKDIRELAIHDLLSMVQKNKLVVLRDFAKLNKDEFLTYVRSAGELLEWNFGPVMELKVQQHPKNYLFTNSPVPLHWDGAFHQEPRFLVFQCVEAPSATAGGETIFVDTEQVWRNASERERKQWQQYHFSYKTEKKAHYGGEVTTKMCQQHPDTGKPILRFAEPVGDDYLNPISAQVVGCSADESAEIFNRLAKVFYNKSVMYYHQWQVGDFLIADNFSLLHGRNAFLQFTPRYIRRIQIL